MIILDTSIWIEHLKNNAYYFPKTSNMLENREILAVECIFGELLQGVKSKSEKEIILKYWTHLPKINYDNVIVKAGEYSAENKLLDHGVGLIDAIILMYAILSNSKIWTLDKKLLMVLTNDLVYADNTNVI
ncbi:MAG: PIN domain-containing protein [Lachnospiraceae bacterium]|jgi:predicted nucleic acid-binding protein|nr:PIN domain-containing protein [Lachnospiraceae bacterium]